MKLKRSITSTPPLPKKVEDWLIMKFCEDHGIPYEQIKEENSYIPYWVIKYEMVEADG